MASKDDDLPILDAYHPITRRKFVHAVHLPGKPAAYIGVRMTDCIWWLEQEGFKEYKIVTDRGSYRAYVAKEPH